MNPESGDNIGQNVVLQPKTKCLPEFLSKENMLVKMRS